MDSLLVQRIPMMTFFLSLARLTNTYIVRFSNKTQTVGRIDIQALFCRLILRRGLEEGIYQYKALCSLFLNERRAWLMLSSLSQVQCTNGFQCGSPMHTINHIPAALSVSSSNLTIMFSINYIDHAFFL